MNLRYDSMCKLALILHVIKGLHSMVNVAIFLVCVIIGEETFLSFTKIAKITRSQM